MKMVPQEDAKFYMKQARCMEKMLMQADLIILILQVCEEIVEVDETLLDEQKTVADKVREAGDAIDRARIFMNARLDVRGGTDE